MAESLDPEAFNDFLDSKPGWIVLTTIAPDGYPHSVPLGYFRDGDHIYCGCVDHTTKIRNIEQTEGLARDRVRFDDERHQGSDDPGNGDRSTRSCISPGDHAEGCGSAGRTSRPPNRTEARVGLHRCCDRAPNLLGLRQLIHLRQRSGNLDDRLEFLERDVGVDDLDRLHSHRLGGLEIDAEIIEEDTLARLHIEALARDLVETPLRLSNAHHTRLDDLVEQVVDLRKRRPSPSTPASDTIASVPDSLVGGVKLLVSIAVLKFAEHRRSASTIAGRITPRSDAITREPSTSNPIARASPSNASTNRAAEYSPARSAPTLLSSGSSR